MVKAYNNGNVVTKYVFNTPGHVANLKVETDKNSFETDNIEIIHLDITLTDEQGNKVTNDDYEVIVEVFGPAKLIGLESGNLSSHENYQADYRKTFRGQLRGYIQSTKEEGDITIKIKSGNLPEKIILLKPITNQKTKL